MTAAATAGPLPPPPPDRGAGAAVPAGGGGGGVLSEAKWAEAAFKTAATAGEKKKCGSVVAEENRTAQRALPAAERTARAAPRQLHLDGGCCRRLGAWKCGGVGSEKKVLRTESKKGTETRRRR